VKCRVFFPHGCWFFKHLHWQWIFMWGKFWRHVDFVIIGMWYYNCSEM